MTTFENFVVDYPVFAVPDSFSKTESALWRMAVCIAYDLGVEAGKKDRISRAGYSEVKE